MNGRDRIAWNLRHLRSLRRVTQESLAVDADVDRTSISGIENGTFNPSIDLLERLARALAVDVGELVALPPTGSAAPGNLPRGRKPNA